MTLKARVISAISTTPVSTTSIALQLRVPRQSVTGILTKLPLCGIVRQGNGGRGGYLYSIESVVG